MFNIPRTLSSRGGNPDSGSVNISGNRLSRCATPSVMTVITIICHYGKFKCKIRSNFIDSVERRLIFGEAKILWLILLRRRYCVRHAADLGDGIIIVHGQCMIDGINQTDPCDAMPGFAGHDLGHAVENVADKSAHTKMGYFSFPAFYIAPDPRPLAAGPFPPAGF